MDWPPKRNDKHHESREDTTETKNKTTETDNNKKIVYANTFLRGGH